MVPAPVVPEVAWQIERNLGPGSDAAFLRLITAGELELVDLVVADYARCIELIGLSRPRRLVDVSVVTVAEKLGATLAMLTDVTSRWCALPTPPPSSSSPEPNRAHRRPPTTTFPFAARSRRPATLVAVPHATTARRSAARCRKHAFAPPPPWRPRSSGPQRRETRTGVGLLDHVCDPKAVGPVVDAETGFQYLRARYYDPATGQFLTRDPLEPVTGTPYAYANNSPLNFTDPSGEIPLVAAVGVGMLIGGGVDLGFQMFENARKGCSVFDDIKWGSVASWGAVGGVTGGLGHWAKTAARAQQSFRWNTRAEKLAHVFDPKHNFGPLVQQFGSEQAVVRQILTAIRGLTPSSGTFEVVATIGGQAVKVRGVVQKGVVKLGTAFPI